MNIRTITLKLISVIFLLTFLQTVYPNGTPEIRVPLRHSDPIKSVAYSPCGKYALSGSNDNTVKLWDVSSGKELRTFTGHLQQVNSVTFSPCGKYALSGSGSAWGEKTDYTLRLWDIATGKELKSFLGHASSVNSVSISACGKFALSGSDDKTLKLWDFSTGKEIKTFTGHSSSVLSVSISPCGKLALSGSWDKTAKLWDIASGKELRTLTGHSEQVNSAAFSPCGKFALTGSWDKSVKLWDIATGKELRTFSGSSGTISFVAFSPDGKYALSGSGTSMRLWNITTGIEVKTFTGHSSGINSASFSPNGKYLLSGSDDKTLKLWDRITGKQLRTFTGYYNRISLAVISPDGKLALSASDSVIKLWNTTIGKELRSLTGHSKSVNSVAISSCSRYALSGSADKTLKLWDIATGKDLKTFSGHSRSVNSVDISPCGKYALSGSGDKTLKLWEIESGKELKTFTSRGIVESVSFSPCGKYAISGTGFITLRMHDNSLQLWNIETGEKLKTFTGHSGRVLAVGFSPSGNYVISGSVDQTLKLWDIESGKEVRTMTGHTGSVNSVSFSPDGRYALSSSDDKTLKLWNISTGTEIKTLIGHTANVRLSSLSPCGKYALSGSDDGTIRYWNTQIGQLVYSAISTADGHSLAWTPEGFFSGDENLAKKTVHIVEGMSVLAIDQLFEVYYRPDLVSAKIRGEAISKYAQNDIRKGIQPPPTIVLSVLTNQGSYQSIQMVNRDDYAISNGVIKVKITANDQGGGIYGVRLFNNEKIVGENLRGFIKVEQASVLENEFTVALERGENQLRAIGFSNNLIESRPELALINYSPPVISKPDMYILAIGINEYRNNRYNLNYCVADMNGFVNTLKPKAEKLFNNVYVNTVSNRDASRENILKSLADLQKKVKPEDLFVFFYAGHGIALEVSEMDRKTRSEFYYILSDVVQMTDPVRVAENGLSGTELRLILSEIKATKQVMFIDACYAGALTEQFAMRGAAEENALARLSRSSGSVIFASTTADQAAVEFKELNHGVFTYVLLEAIGGGAVTASGQITAGSIKTYVDEKIPDYTEKYRGTPQWPTTFMWGQDFPIGIK